MKISLKDFIINKNSYYYLFVILLIAQRLVHFGSVIDEPHAWRQFDTFFYAFDFYKNGFTIFKPSVCWLGGYRTLILEFPLVSILIALIYKILAPSVFFARLVPFLFYLVSIYYLYRIVLQLYYSRLAKLTVLVYLTLPLSLFYSRAVQIDFCALAFSLAMLYYYILGFEKNILGYVLLGSICGAFAFLVKAPYPFYLFIPLLYFVYTRGKLKYLLKVISILIFPVIIFVVWELYSTNVNSAAPDWYFIPDYFKFNNMSEWYFGSFSQRLAMENWEKIFIRFAAVTTSPIGLVLFAVGLFTPFMQGYKKSFFFYYSIGILIYILIFFNLIIIHEYYQIPILVVTSFFIASALDFIFRKISEKSSKASYIATAIVFILISTNCIWIAEKWYYRVDNLRLEAANFIRTNTGENDLIIVSIKDTDPRDPRILAPALRYGWSIKSADLNKKLIQELVSNGAVKLALVSDAGPDSVLRPYLDNFQKQEFSLHNNNSKLYIYSFTR